ncbi:MAG: YjbF family lipoprotein [Rhodobacteraceae bacterium]|nr:YjbF family lipoprotein [Paracoccaceae bacterium]
MIPRFIGLCLSALVLAGCGSNSTETEVTKALRELVQRPAKKRAEAEGRKAVLSITRAVVDAAAVSLIRVRLEGTGAVSTMTVIDVKDNGSAWAGPDGGVLYFRNGVLFGSRGLGQDLMTMAAPPLAREIADGHSRRRYRYLDGDELLVTLHVACHTRIEGPRRLTILGRSFQTEAVFQRCEGDRALAFENRYWVLPGTALVIKSQQFIAPKFGRADIETLTRQIP